MIGGGIALFGLLLEIVGVLLMANSYLGAAARKHWPLLLISALFRGKRARGAIRLSGLNEDDRLLAIQGLALIGLGFLCQACMLVWTYVAE